MNEKRVEVNVFTLMDNHIHLIWQIQKDNEREAVQRDFLKFVSQTIIRDLKISHPAVLEKFYVGAKDRKYQIWERNPLSSVCKKTLYLSVGNRCSLKLVMNTCA